MDRQTKAAIAIMGVVILVIIILGFYGWLSGAWAWWCPGHTGSFWCTGK